MQRVCRSLPRIVCGEVMVAEPRAPELVRIWVTPKNRYKKHTMFTLEMGECGVYFSELKNKHSSKVFKSSLQLFFFLTFEFPQVITKISSDNLYINSQYFILSLRFISMKIKRIQMSSYYSISKIVYLIYMFKFFYECQRQQD